MRLRRLNEAPGDDEPISVVSRKPSEFTVDNLPEETQELIKKGQWTEAYRTLINTRDIEAFNNYFIDNCPLLANFKSQIATIRQQLLHELMSLGDRAYQEETNPILRFLNTYFGVFNHKFENGDQFQNLVNWWSRGIVTDKNLKETKIAKSILLNNNLYGMQNSTYITQAYYWLSKKDNIKAYINLDNNDQRYIAQKIEPTIKYILGAQERHADGRFGNKPIYYDLFRDMIIFVEPFDPSGSINRAEEIQARLTRLQDAVQGAQEEKQYNDDSVGKTGETEQNAAQRSRGAKDTIRVQRLNYSKDDIRNIFNKGMDNITPQEAQLLVTYLSDRGKI